MSIEHDIAAAQNQRDALIVLGRALDRITTRLAEVQMPPVPEPDPWSQWGSPGFNVAAQTEDDEVLVVVDPAPATEVLRQIAATQQQLATATDPEDIQALSARLRLLQDTGQPMGEYVPQGLRAGVSSDGTNGDVVLAPVSPERQANRRQWAHDVRLGEFIPTLTAAEAADTYAKGGPMWLYLGNRDAVMALSLAARVAMVNDIELDSPAQAQEVARDILKNEDSADKDITIQAIDAMSNA